MRNTTAITGLVVWDGLSTVDAGGVVENYYVNVYDVTNGKKPLTSENVLVSLRDTYIYIYQYIEFRFNITSN